MHCVLARVAQPCRFSPQSRDLNADGLIRVTQFCLSKLARLTSEVQRLAGLTRPVEGAVIKITTLRISDDVALQSRCSGKMYRVVLLSRISRYLTVEESKQTRL